MCSFWGPISLGLSGLSGLPGSLFPLPVGDVFLHYSNKFSFIIQISFQFLAVLLFLFSFWHPYNLDVGMFQVVLVVPKPLLIFLNSCFFILFWVNVYFSLLLQTIDLRPISFPSLLVPHTFLLISLFITFTFPSILQPYQPFL